MKVNRLRSVGAKLFYMTSLLVLITITGNSWQFARTFISYQKEQIQNTIQAQAEISGGRIESELQIWKSQIATAIPAFKGGLHSNELDVQIKNFLNANQELLALTIFESPTLTSKKFKKIGNSFTPYLSDLRFEDKNTADISAMVNSLSERFLYKYQSKIARKTLYVDSIAKTTKLPLMMLATRFEVTGSKSIIWAVLTVWQSNILKAIPNAVDTEIALIDKKGRIISSQKFSQLRDRELFPGKQLLDTALSSKTPSGFQDEYMLKGERKLGAFFRMPQYDFIVLVQKDAEKAYLVMKKNLIVTTLWALLFILISMLFSYIVSRGITKNLRELVYATDRIASGDFSYRILPKTQDEVAQLGLSVNTMSSKIVELMSNQVEKAKFEKELETAKMVQQTFFPKKQIECPNLVVHGFYTPASQCGGDLWGHFPIEDGVDFLFVADAMGHGAPAALVTAMAYSTTMTIADIVKDKKFHDNSPSKILDRINRIIFDAVGGTISMTFFASIIDTRRKRIIFSNAGHNFPLLMPAKSSDPRLVQKRKSKKDFMPISLKQMGSPLGIDPKSKYQDMAMELEPGDKIVYFTDGLIECTSSSGNSWGRKNLLEQLIQGKDLPADQLRDQIIAQSFGFFGSVPICDDVTLVVAELSKEWSETTNKPMDEIKIEAVTKNNFFSENQQDIRTNQSANTLSDLVLEPPQTAILIAANENPTTTKTSLIKTKFRIRLPKIDQC